MSQFDPDRYRVESDADRLLGMLEAIRRELAEIRKNTERKKPGRPKKEQSRG